MAQYKSQGTIDRVVPGSPAEQVGIAQGDRLLSLNGTPVKDLIGYQFYQVSEQVTVEVAREGAASSLVFTVRKPEQQDLGLEFVDPTFDGIKRCNNHCPFCFVDQNAPGLRKSLDIKDDDYRYSFLFGGFITLTNLM
jgi:NifB/MoaA-like Fe-S oxidoreductase